MSFTCFGDCTVQAQNCFLLTTATANQASYLWANDQLDLTRDFRIDADLLFGDDDAGGDGIAFVLQTEGTDATGGGGGGLGYTGISPSVGVEFDTFQDSAVNDPAFDHTSISLNGAFTNAAIITPPGRVQASPTNVNIEDNTLHSVAITYDINLGTLNVFFENLNLARITVNIDLQDQLASSTAFWGFTAATGGAFNNQRVCITSGLTQTQNPTPVPTPAPSPAPTLSPNATPEPTPAPTPAPVAAPAAPTMTWRKFFFLQWFKGLRGKKH